MGTDHRKLQASRETWQEEGCRGSVKSLRRKESCIYDQKVESADHQAACQYLVFVAMAIGLRTPLSQQK